METVLQTEHAPGKGGWTVARVRKNMPVEACPDDMDPDAIPIVSGENAYGGRGAALTAVLVDGEKAWFDEAALHGRTAVEQQVKWLSRREDVPNGRTLYPVWVYIRPARRGEFQYFGLVASEMVIDEAAGVGYKSLGDHVNRLEKAMKGHIDLELLDATARDALATALRTYPEVLANSRDELKEALGLPVSTTPSQTADD